MWTLIPESVQVEQSYLWLEASEEALELTAYFEDRELRLRKVPL